MSFSGTSSPPTLEATLKTLRSAILRILLTIEGALAILHALVTWTPSGTFSKQAIRIFHVDRERNIPTWFSASQWLFLGILLAVVYYLDRRLNPNKKGLSAHAWLICSAGAVLLSMDEAAALHETMGNILGQTLRDAYPGTFLAFLGTYPSYYWALVYVPIAIPLTIVLGRLVWKELHSTRMWVVYGMGLFLFGAVGLDYIEGRYGTAKHTRIPVALFGVKLNFDIFLVEELCEMVGVTLVVYAFLRHLSRQALLYRELPRDY